MELPTLYKVKQKFDATRLSDVAGEAQREIEACGAARRARPGGTVAVAVGSRGIRNLADIVAVTVRSLKDMGLRPFIMPAMGSHGGATAEGQAGILEGLGITENRVGAPIRSDMEVESLERLDSGADVYMAKDALAADHLVVINRVKPHTAFRGQVESGLCKMLTVGCGKHQGALCMHRFGLGETIIPAAEIILDRIPVLFGLAIVENSLEETYAVRAARPEDFIETDAELLKTAGDLMPRIPVNDLDVLIVDEMGKNISGAGIDPNIVGMWRRLGGPRVPDYRTIVVLDLTAPSHGNAIGLGIADLTTRRVMDLVDIKATYTNVLASGIWSSARMPIALDHDRAAIETAVSRVPDPENVRLIRIVNTLYLDTFWASKALLPELAQNPNIELDDAPRPLDFENTGRLRPFSSTP